MVLVALALSLRTLEPGVPYLFLQRIARSLVVALVILVSASGTAAGDGEAVVSTPHVTATLVADPGEIDPLDDLDDLDVYVHAATAESTASGDSSTTTEPPATATSGAEAPTHPVRGADLAGYGGAAGAFAFGALLLSGRRRRGW